MILTLPEAALILLAAVGAFAVLRGLFDFLGRQRAASPGGLQAWSQPTPPHPKSQQDIGGALDDQTVAIARGLDALLISTDALIVAGGRDAEKVEKALYAMRDEVRGLSANLKIAGSTKEGD